MKKIFTILICLMMGLSVSAQTKVATVRGTIVDALNNQPLLGALVVIDSTRHATANARGQFSVAGVPMKEVSVTVSYLGYKTVTQKLNIKDAATNMGTIKLIEEGSTIDMVTVEARSTIAVQKGDTVQYNASAFKTNPDADAADLASKMPGITVTDGKVQAQGEDVSRVYVDGKMMFGDDAMAALRNLPADAVESIQMFDELSDEAKFIGYNDGKTNRALNVVTKHKINRSTTGRIETGYGIEMDKNADGNYKSRYNVNGTYNTFTEKNRLSLNAAANNVNVMRFTSGQGGGGGGMGGGSGITTVNSVGMNYSGDWRKNMKFTGSYFYDSNNNKRYTTRIQDYFPTEQFQSQIYKDTVNSNTNNYTHRANIRFEYQPGERDRLLFTPNISFSDNNSLSRTRANNTTNGEVITSDNNKYSKGNNYNVGGQLLWSHKLGNKPGRAITTSLGGTLRENSSNGWQVDTLQTSAQYINLINDNNGWTRTFRGRVNYAEPIGERSRLLFNYTLRLDDSKSDKQVVDRETMLVDSTLTNSYTRKYLRQGGEIGYSYNIKDKLNFSTSIEYEVSDMQRQQLIPIQPQYDRVFYAWLPQLEFQYKISKSKNIRFGYEGENNLPSIEDLQNVINNSDPLKLTAGNPNLKQSYTHNINFRYQTSNIEKSTNFFMMLRASKTDNNVSYRTITFANDTILHDYNDYKALKNTQLRTPVNTNGAYSLSAMTSYSFPLKWLKTNMNIGGMYSFQRSPSYSRNTLNYSSANTFNLMVGFVSNISSNVDFNISSRSNYSYASNTAKDNTEYFRETVSAMLNVIFLKGFVFNTNYSFNYQHNSSQGGSTLTYSLWNAGLGHKFLKRRTAEFRVTMYDILNQNKSYSHSIGDSYIQDTKNEIIGRYVMATLSYRFNSMNALSKAPAAEEERPGQRRMMGTPPSGGQGGNRQGGGGYHRSGGSSGFF